MPWIHIDDLCNFYIQAIKDVNIKGAFNGVAPEHETNRTFSKKLAKAFKRPFVNLGAPAFALKVAFGEMSTILLNGSRVSSEKTAATGFQFQFPLLNDALKALAKN